MHWFKRRKETHSKIESSPFDGSVQSHASATSAGQDRQVDWEFGPEKWTDWLIESQDEASFADERYFYPMRERLAQEDRVQDGGAPREDSTAGDAAKLVVWSGGAVSASHAERGRLTAAFRGPAATQRVAAVRHALDRALERWWKESELPSSALLRDGLLVLEAGHPLDESQLSLLLRTALANDRGIHTALRHQTDPERTAVILADAVTSPTVDLSLARVERLAWEDPHGELWLSALQHELVAYAELTPAYERLAMDALRLHATPPGGAQTAASSLPTAGARSVDPLADQDSSSRRGIRWLLALLALVVAALLLFGDQLSLRTSELIEVAGGAYALRTREGEMRTVNLDAFAIERYEVTVEAFRRCHAAGACPWPDEQASATRSDYLTNRTYDNHPMIHVNWPAASAYCEWAGMRLPSEDEWQVAASYAPATARAYGFPWGDAFQVQLSNSQESGLGDTVTIGTYDPAGSSPMGMADAAGNVAEWTATAASGDGNSFRIKGGSFVDTAPYLQPHVSQSQPAGNGNHWLGFRCAASPQ
jgi:formylglycine-generating enzyme required for sulfatase activity